MAKPKTIRTIVSKIMLNINFMFITLLSLQCMSYVHLETEVPPLTDEQGK